MVDFPEMKMLEDFKDEEGICKGAEVLGLVLEAVSEEKNEKLNGEKNPFKLFSGIMANTPKKMMEIFASLSGVPAEEYHCNGSQAVENIMKLCNDKVLLSLFLSQSRTGDATSSGSALETTEAP